MYKLLKITAGGALVLNEDNMAVSQMQLQTISMLINVRKQSIRGVKQADGELTLTEVKGTLPSALKDSDNIVKYVALGYQKRLINLYFATASSKSRAITMEFYSSLCCYSTSSYELESDKSSFKTKRTTDLSTTVKDAVLSKRVVKVHHLRLSENAQNVIAIYTKLSRGKLHDLVIVLN